MKKLLLIIVAVGFVVYAEEATHETNAPATEKRTETRQVKDKSQRLFEFINACMPNTPPGDGGVAATDAPPTLPPGGGNASADGAALFQSKCISCHSSNGKPLANKKGVDLVGRLDKDMPQKGSEQEKSLTPADRATLRAFLQTK